MKKAGIVLVVFALFLAVHQQVNPQRWGKLLRISVSRMFLETRSDWMTLKERRMLSWFFYADSRWSLSSRRLGELQEKISEIENLDGEVVAFATGGTQDDVEISKSFHEITFTLIPTPNRSVAKQFGVRTYATIIIDKDGIIRFKEIDDITSASYIVEELQAI